jgi:hypothetical protein
MTPKYENMYRLNDYSLGMEIIIAKGIPLYLTENLDFFFQPVNPILYS